MQRINTCFNNINVSFNIDRKDLIINRKDKKISIYSEDIKAVIRHLLINSFDSKDDDLNYFNKCTKMIYKKIPKLRQKYIFNQVDKIDELTPVFVLSTTIVSDISFTIASCLYSIICNDFFTSPNDLFVRLELIEEVFDNEEFELTLISKDDGNDIEQLNKYNRNNTHKAQSSNKTHTKKPNILIDELQDLQSSYFNKKQIVIEIPNEVTEVCFYQYIYLILNQEWLVPNCLEIQLDLSKCAAMHNSKLKSNTILLILCLMYFINKNNLQSIGRLNFNIPYAYTSELNQYFLSKNIQITSTLHFLEFINAKITNLSSLSISFNAIDSFTFQTIISIITNNTQLKTLTLKLFPNDSSFSSTFSITQLSTFCSMQNIIIESSQNLFIDNYTYNEPEYYLGKLIKAFQVNLDLLLYSFSLNSQNLTELKIDFELPSVILLSGKYIEAILKFFFKFMLYIESSMNKITSLELKAQNFPFDAEKFLNIENEIDNFKMNNNKTLNELVLNFRILHLNNLHMMIPSKMRNLFLGEIDNESLVSFSSNIHLLKELICLRFTLCNLNQLNIEDNKETIKVFIRSLKRNRIESIVVEFKVYLTQEMIKQIIQLTNDDYIQFYSFTFYKNQIKDNTSLTQFEEEIKHLSNEIYYKLRPREIYSIILGFNAIYCKRNKNNNNYKTITISNKYYQIPVPIQNIIKRINTFIQIRWKKNIEIVLKR